MCVKKRETECVCESKRHNGVRLLASRSNPSVCRYVCDSCTRHTSECVFIHACTLEGCLFGVSVCVCSRACGSRMCVCVCVLSNIVTLVYAASVCLQLSHCDRERVREVEYRESDNTKE